MMATTTPMATTLAHLAPFECSELGVPRATKTIDLGRDRTTVDMYTQNFMPVHANKGLARSICSMSMSLTFLGFNRMLTWWNDAVSND